MILLHTRKVRVKVFLNRQEGKVRWKTGEWPAKWVRVGRLPVRQTVIWAGPLFFQVLRGNIKKGRP
jgi:hypothetical protein